jgi:uncharacterized protein (TIGR02145 family)
VKIFINYRRQTDEDNLVFAIANSLMGEFGVENVFFDKQVIKAGSEFPKEIDKALENCRIFIPVIGKEWIRIMNKRQNLDEPDYVLNEIENALGKGVFVLPILVDDASMPSEKELPPQLNKLSLINAVNISSDPKQLPRDIKLLISELNDIFSRSPKKSKSQLKEGFKKLGFNKIGLILGILISSIVIAVFAVIYFRNEYIKQKLVEPEKEVIEISSTVKNIRSENIEQKPVEPKKEKSEIPPTVKNSKTLIGNEVTDIDGNIYKTVALGNQIWMAENLKVTHYSNGDPISNVPDSLRWIYLKTGAYCSYRNLDSNSKIYGQLYNWYAVNDRRSLCPVGWHVPSHTEIDSLVFFVGGWRVAGGMLKEAGYSHWRSPNTGADNITGFSALPGGFRSHLGGFNKKGDVGIFWSSTDYIEEHPERATSPDAYLWGYDLYLEFYTAESPRLLHELNVGGSVRCVKD